MTKLVRIVDAGDNSVLNSSGSVITVGNVKRSTEIAHRVGIATPDTLAVPGTLTLTAISEAGSTLANVAYFVGVAAGNRWGTTGPGTLPSSITPTANQAVRCAFAQVVGADYYDIFLSTAAAPLWVGRITEAQRATGDQIISAVGVVSARAGGTVAGTIDIGIVGTGLATSAIPFTSNSAITPASITPIDCTGYQSAVCYFKVTCTDLRALPTLGYRFMLKSVLSPNDWFSSNNIAAVPLSSVNNSAPLEFMLSTSVNGIGAFAVVLNQFSAQIASIDVWVVLI